MALPARPNAVPRPPRLPAPPRPPAPRPMNSREWRFNNPTRPQDVTRPGVMTNRGPVSTGLIAPPNAAAFAASGPAPAATSPAAAAAAAAPVVNDPVSVAYQNRIDAITDRINSLGDIFNPQREVAAINARNALTDNGWFDRASLVQNLSGAGDVSYGVSGIGEGQNQRDQVTGSDGNFNARGALFSSAANRQRNSIISRLQTQRARMVEALAQSQRASLAEQMQAGVGYGNDLANARGEYEDWKSAQGGRA